MPQTENTPTIASRTCVTCGKTFYVDLYDEKMRAAKGFAPRSECNECMQARMRLIEEQNRRNRENGESRLVSEGKRIYKLNLLMRYIGGTLIAAFASIVVISGVLSGKYPKTSIFFVAILIIGILASWIHYNSI